MNNKLKEYQRIREDLQKQIALCKEYKTAIQTFLTTLDNQYKHGEINHHTYQSQIHSAFKGKHPQHWHSLYDRHIVTCLQHLDFYNKEIAALTSRLDKNKVFYGVVIFACLVLFGSLFFFKSSITGSFGYQHASVVSSDGYSQEGAKWMDIKGSRFYERCLQVQAEQDFDAARITAKIANAADTRELTFSLYNHDAESNEPLDQLAACTVSDYSTVWKSCTLDNLHLQQGAYWICASMPHGDKDTPYFTLGYQVGDHRKTALWTGDHWQTLEKVSYTIKVGFMRYE